MTSLGMYMFIEVWCLCQKSHNSRAKPLECYNYYKCFHVCFFSDIYDCYLNPCLNNGTCIDGLNDYNCSCVPGLVGENCSNSKFNNIVSQYKHQVYKIQVRIYPFSKYICAQQHFVSAGKVALHSSFYNFKEEPFCSCMGKVKRKQ